jgi:hypothetical protein
MKKNIRVNVSFKESEFGVIRGLHSPVPNSSHHGIVPIHWSNEQDVQGIVKIVLEELILSTSCLKAASEAGKLSCRSECMAGVSGERADFWVVRIDELPVGVVEVKTPVDGILDHKAVHAQIAGYMVLLKEMYGLEEVFGIETSYRQWRITWLSNEKTVKLAAATKVDPTETTTRTLLPPSDIAIPTAVDGADAGAGGANTEDADVFAVTLYGSPVIEWDNATLIDTLATALVKMYVANRVLPEKAGGKRSRLTLCAESPFLTERAITILDTRNARLPGAQELCIIGDLQGGRDGRVWLVSTFHGVLGVVKFVQGGLKDTADNEAEMWRNLWNVKADVKMLWYRWALVMPFFYPLTWFQQTVAKIGDDVSKAVIDALSVVRSKGYRHMDPKPNNVGLYLDKENLHAVFLDLTDVQSWTWSDSDFDSDSKRWLGEDPVAGLDLAGLDL